MQFSDNNVLIVGGVLLVPPSPCAVTIARCPMLRLVFTLFFCAVPLAAQTMPPEADKQLAHDIYKEFVEIRSGFTTGSTTPVAEAAAARLRAAGFPGQPQAAPASRPHRCCGSQARRLEHGPVSAD